MQSTTGIEHTTFTKTISGSIALSFEIDQMNGPKKEYYMVLDTDKRMIRTMEKQKLGSLQTNIFSYIAIPIADD